MCEVVHNMRSDSFYTVKKKKKLGKRKSLRQPDSADF